MKNNIVLIGYMGCGKSTIGRKIAEMFQMPFVDTDVWIEEKEGISISEIFEVKGEPYFRDLETQCLRELLKKDKTVDFRKENDREKVASERKPYLISVGGGLPVREENREFLKQLGLVIYLKAKPETIYERVKSDTTRPLLQTENPFQKIIDMLAAREEKYKKAAHRIVEVDDKSVMEIIQEILENDENMWKEEECREQE